MPDYSQGWRVSRPLTHGEKLHMRDIHSVHSECIGRSHTPTERNTPTGRVRTALEKISHCSGAVPGVPAQCAPVGSHCSGSAIALPGVSAQGGPVPGVPAQCAPVGSHCSGSAIALPGVSAQGALALRGVSAKTGRAGRFSQCENGGQCAQTSAQCAQNSAQCALCAVRALRSANRALVRIAAGLSRGFSRARIGLMDWYHRYW